MRSTDRRWGGVEGRRGGGSPGWMIEEGTEEMSASLRPRPAVTSNASEEELQARASLSIPQENQENYVESRKRDKDRENSKKKKTPDLVQLCRYLYIQPRVN